MALIACPECGVSISDRAIMCSHCSFPLAKHFQELREKEEAERLAQEQAAHNERVDTLNFFIIGGVVLAIIAAIGSHVAGK